MNDLYLVHHGIKGQKWGVRRFQNEDGTLTKAGKDRYEKYSESYKKNKELERSSREKGDLETANKAKNAALSDKYNMRYEKKNMKTYKSADRGKKLVKEKGETIESIYMKKRLGAKALRVASGTAATIAGLSLKSGLGKKALIRLGTDSSGTVTYFGVPIASIVAATTAVGSAAASVALDKIGKQQQADIRAYAEKEDPEEFRKYYNY